MNLPRAFLFVTIMVAAGIPYAANAFPFGGQIRLFHVCYNETLFARLSPPVPGDYVWTTATRTYQFGPPRASGQWLLGLTGIPFDCLWSINPIFPVPAIAIMMMGSSQASFQGVSSGGYSTDPTTLPRPLPGGGGTGGGGTGGGTGIGGGSSSGASQIIISEIFASVDAAHGTDPRHEWVELYNTTNVTIDISGWTIATASSSDVLPGGTSIGAGSFLLVTQTNELRNFWSFPSDVRIAVLNSPIGSGLSRTGDSVTLRNSSGTAIDAVSWGTSTVAFTPAAPVVPLGHSLSRLSIFTDTNAASDWTDRTTPTPGN